jgi:ribonuclease MRP protein subunit RMP1
MSIDQPDLANRVARISVSPKFNLSLEAMRERKADDTDFICRAFSNLVADNQYAALGLVLMGTLARVKRVIRPFGPEKIRSECHSEDRLQDLTSELEKNDAVLLGEADLGEVVNREEVGKMVASSGKVGGSGAARKDNSGEGEGSSDEVQINKGKKKRKDVIKESTAEWNAVESRTMIMTTKGPKKKRRKGDAFDDLFSSLT